MISVNMAAFAIAQAPDTLATMGIGSCVAVCLYDRRRKLGGLAHIMLPHNKTGDLSQCGKYADSGIDALLRLMGQGCGAPHGLSAKIVGGANVLTPGKTNAITVGKNNIDSVKSILTARNIPIAGEDTGGFFGRSLLFDTATGAVAVKLLSQPQKRATL